MLGIVSIDCSLTTISYAWLCIAISCSDLWRFIVNNGARWIFNSGNLGLIYLSSCRNLWFELVLVVRAEELRTIETSAMGLLMKSLFLWHTSGDSYFSFSYLMYFMNVSTSCINHSVGICRESITLIIYRNRCLLLVEQVIFAYQHASLLLEKLLCLCITNSGIAILAIFIYHRIMFRSCNI